jgi:hypothetical protein
MSQWGVGVLTHLTIITASLMPHGRFMADAVSAGDTDHSLEKLYKIHLQWSTYLKSIPIPIVTIMGPTEVIVGFLPNDYPQPVQWQILQINQVRQSLLRRRVPESE